MKFTFLAGIPTLLVAMALLPCSSNAFLAPALNRSPPSPQRQISCRSVTLNANKSGSSSMNNAQLSSRSEFLQKLAFVVATVGLPPTTAQVVYADDDSDLSSTVTTSASSMRKIAECKVPGSGEKLGNCVSTSSVKQVDAYVAPWTFDVSIEEAVARLKGVLRADPDLYRDLEEEPNYVRVKAARGLVMDQLEFAFDEKDKLVRLRSAQVRAEDDGQGISDFGANRRRLDAIRKEAQVFEVMGGSGYDSIEMRGTGPLGQLKAFYGLQSGAGFEDVFER